MKTVLVRSPYSQVYELIKGSRKIKQRGVHPPLGLLYVGAYLQQYAYQVELIDAELHGLGPDDVAREVVARQADVVGVGATTPEFDLACGILAAVKRARPSVVTVIGGVHPTILSDETLAQNAYIDYVVRGEGEVTMLELMRALEGAGSLSDVAGLSYRDDGRIIHNPDRGPIPDLDALPWPARDLVDVDDYLYHMPRKGMVPTATIITSRGCPYRCIYCFPLTPRRIRFRSVTSVIGEIEHVMETYGIRHFLFTDDTFAAKRSRVMELCDEIIERRLNITWFCQTRVNTLNRELLERLKEAGCFKLSIGVESGNQDTLDLIRKDVRLEQYRQVYRLVKEVGIEARGSFMLGLPYDTPQTIRQTIDFAKELDIDQAYFNITTPYPGTELYAMALRGEGLRLLSRDWREFKRWGNAVIELDEVSREELIEWQKRALAEFFARPRIVWNHVKKFLRGEFSLYYYEPLLEGLRLWLGTKLWRRSALAKPAKRPGELSQGRIS